MSKLGILGGFFNSEGFIYRINIKENDGFDVWVKYILIYFNYGCMNNLLEKYLKIIYYGVIIILIKVFYLINVYKSIIIVGKIIILYRKYNRYLI